MVYAKILLLVGVTALCTTYIFAKPYDKNSFVEHDNLSRCERLSDVEITCQKCAKITKSPVVYPMCCTDKDDAYRWCFKYINFGLQKRGEVSTDFRKHWLNKHHMMKYVDDSKHGISSNFV